MTYDPLKLIVAYKYDTKIKIGTYDLVNILRKIINKSIKTKFLLSFLSFTKLFPPILK